MSLQKIRRSVGYLSKHFPEFDRPLADVVFLTDGVSIFVLTEDPRILLDTLHDGQFVLSLAVGKLAEDTKARILSMERQEEAEGHVFEVVIEPDRDVYLAYCPALPGCITWGETEVQAYQYIQDAVEVYLEDMIEDGEPVPGIGNVKSIEDIKPVIKVRETKDQAVA